MLFSKVDILIKKSVWM